MKKQAAAQEDYEYSDEEILAALKAPPSEPVEASEDYSDEEILAALKTPEAEKPAVSTPRAALEGFGQGATFGYLPQLRAALGTLLGDPNEKINEELRQKGFNIIEPSQDYVSRRDRATAESEALQKGAPGAYLAGNVGGVIATAPLLTKTLAGIAGKGATLATTSGRVKNAARIGALQGAIQNPGDIEGETAPLQLKERIEGAGLGALMGGGSQGVMEGGKSALKALSNLPKSLKDFSEERAFAALGASKGDAKRTLKLDSQGEEGKRLKELGRFALDQKLVSAGDKIDEVVNKTAALREKVGSELGQVYEEVNKLSNNPRSLERLSEAQRSALKESSLSRKEIGKEFLEEFEKATKGTPEGSQAIRNARRIVQDFNESDKPATILDLHDFRQRLDDLLYAKNRVPGQLPKEIQPLEKFRTHLKKTIDQRVKVLDDDFCENFGGRLKALNQEFNKVADIHQIGKDRMASEVGNNLFSITDKIFMAGGAAPGLLEGDVEKMASGAMLGLASKGARTYGRSLLAKGADQLAKGSSKIPFETLSPLADKLNQYPALAAMLAQGIARPPRNEKRRKALEDVETPILGKK